MLEPMLCDSDEGVVLLPHQVLLTNEEVSQVKHLRGPGLVLLGTKPAKCLRDHHNVRMTATGLSTPALYPVQELALSVLPFKRGRRHHIVSDTV
jgi:hypothetical protein